LAVAGGVKSEVKQGGLIFPRERRVNRAMNSTTKGIIGLVVWLLAGFALTEVATLTFAGGEQPRKPTVIQVEADRTVA
jgi:hypothetical protein